MAIFRLIFPALLLLLLLQPLSAAEPRDAKRVLILYSEDEAHPAHEMTDQGIRAAFGSNKFFNVQLYTEYLDVSRFGEPSHARATADYLRGKYSGVEIHVIITVYPYALDFLLAERSTLFSEVPIIAAEITSRSYAENLERSPTNLLSGMPLKAASSILLSRICPYLYRPGRTCRGLSRSSALNSGSSS